MALHVTIVTPTLNSAPFLPGLLASIDAQSYADVEHVVVDGESRDGGLDVLHKAAGPRRRLIVRRDRSMYEALNTGIRASESEVVACLNADDLYFPDTVSEAVRFLEGHPEVDIAYGDQLSLLTDTQSFDFYLMENEYSDPWGWVLVYFSQPSVFMRRRVFDRVGLFDPDLRAAGDFDLWFRAFRAGVVFRRIPRILTLVRFHGENLSLSDTWQREHEELKRRYLPVGLRAVVAERYRRFKRKLSVNQFTLPWRAHLPSRGVRFDRGRYLRFLWNRRITDQPILTIDLPYFRYEAFRALNFHGGL